MKPKSFLAGAFLTLLFPVMTLAVGAPSVDSPPSEIDANTYTLKINTELGAKITVVGGSSDIAPFTDGTNGDVKDGKVNFKVALAQNQKNTFSITAEKNGVVSSSTLVTIVEKAKSGGSGSGDTTPPAAPTLLPVPEFVDTVKYDVSGKAEANVNITSRTPDGTVTGTTRTDGEGNFKVSVTLEKNKTNRFNISATDDSGNEGAATQVILRLSALAPDGVEEEEKEEVEEVASTSAPSFFDDVIGHWAESYINQLYEKKVVSGKSERVFDPNGFITRAEMTKIALLAFDYSVDTRVDSSPFSDVPLDAWFTPFVHEAQRTSIVRGYEGGGFGPNDFITRSAALKIILEAAKVDIGDESSNFSDVPSEEWFRPYVAYAQVHEIVGGYEDGTFRPGAHITRAEVAKIVIKMLENKD